ncbi:MAG: ferredoxin reductase family protein [Lysobacterales bacterium]
MKSALSSVVYVGLYLLLALLPLHVAMVADPITLDRPWRLEFAVGCGFIAFSLIWLEFALVSRLRTLSDSFGTDTLVQFHRSMGISASVLLLTHVLLLLPASGWQALLPWRGSWLTQSGALAFWALVVLTVSSLWRRRLRVSFDLWNRLHRVAALVAAVAGTLHLWAVAGYSARTSVRLATLLIVALCGGILIWYAVVRPLHLWRRPWRVSANRALGADTRLLTVRPDGHPGYAYHPGQFAWLISGRTPFSRAQHPITIASAPAADGSQSFAIKALGDWSGQVVPQLQPGARLWVEGPYGALTVDRLPAQGFVLIAGGIGITPMLAIVQTLAERRDPRPCLLFYAANDRSRVVFAEELAALQQRMALTLVYVFEHPRPGDGGESGRITPELMRRYLPAELPWFQCLICGPNPMMDSVEQSLRALGVAADRIHSERFDQV